MMKKANEKNLVFIRARFASQMLSWESLCSGSRWDSRFAAQSLGKESLTLVAGPDLSGMQCHTHCKEDMQTCCTTTYQRYNGGVGNPL
jgi:hypothetical protein